jgi:hypothetical protein
LNTVRIAGEPRRWCFSGMPTYHSLSVRTTNRSSASSNWSR